jgi:hypothetical protein
MPHAGEAPGTGRVLHTVNGELFLPIWVETSHANASRCLEFVGIRVLLIAIGSTAQVEIADDDQGGRQCRAIVQRLLMSKTNDHHSLFSR